MLHCTTTDTFRSVVITTAASMLAAAVSSVVGLGATAHAGPGDHVRSGEATFIPGIDVGGEYRTNLYRSETNPTGGANLRVAPQASFTLGGEDHDFKAGGIWELRKFLFAEDVTGSTITGAERVANLDRYNDFSLNAGTTLFKREAVGFEWGDQISFRNNSSDAEFSEAPFNSQFRNNMGAGIRINPGPALSITPGAAWTFDQYRVAPGADGERLLNARHTYGPKLGARWAFLPRTSLYFAGSYMWNAWQEGPVSEAAGAAFTVPNSQFARSMVGVDGRFTKKLFLDVGAGYGVGIYEGGINASGLAGILARIQGRYQIRESDAANGGTAFTLGYEKTFRDSFFTNFSEINRVYTGLNAAVGNFRPSVRYELRFEGYEGEEITRDDIVNRLNVDAGYQIQTWASIVPGVAWQQRASNVDNVEYDDWNIHLLANFTY